MPYETTFFQLPCGAQACRLEVRGDFSLKDTEPLLQLLATGGRLHGMPLLVPVQELNSITSDARAAILKASRGRAESWTAAVVTRATIRVTLNFIMRIQGRKKTRMFTSEAEALEWLDARVREDMATG
jgi:hypothetical protein